jgi:PAS domain S-box-containing protein
MYIVTSKPKRISVYSGLVHIYAYLQAGVIVGGKAAPAHRQNAQTRLMIFMKMGFAARYHAAHSGRRRVMSLRLRINLVITLVMAAFASAMVYLIVNDLRSSVREETEATTRVAVQLIETLVAGVYLEPGSAQRTEALIVFLRRAGRVRANTVQLYDQNGALLYQSPPASYRAGSRTPEWFSRLMRPDVPAARLALPGGAIMVVPDPTPSIVEAWEQLQNFALLALGFLVVVNGMVFWLLARALKPLPTILEGLAELTRNRFQARLPAFQTTEFASLSRGFNRLAQALEESRARNQQLALIAQQSSDAIIIRDLTGTITYCNGAAERLLGYAEHELVGSPATAIVPVQRHAELAAQLKSIERREPIELVQTERLAKDGRVVEVLLSAAPLVDPASDRVIGEICSMRDITGHKRMRAAERELEQNRKLTALIQAQLEDERRAIARELHDELSQYVTAIKTIGTAIAGHAGESRPDIREHAETIVSAASHIYDVVHRIVRRLRPSGLDDLGLAETLRDAVSGWARRHPQVQWDLALAGALDHLGEGLNITVYRIVQEALTNVVRHARASQVRVSVRREPAGQLEDAIVVTVRDDGQGFTAAAASADGGFGIAGMRERVQAFGGSLAIAAAPGQGVTVSAVLPVAAVRRAALAES